MKTENVELKLDASKSRLMRKKLKKKSIELASAPEQKKQKQSVAIKPTESGAV